MIFRQIYKFQVYENMVSLWKSVANWVRFSTFFQILAFLVTKFQDFC